MSQDYQLPVGSDSKSAALTELIPDSLEALRSLFSGASEPSSTVPYQLWADTTTGVLKIRNAADSAWIVMAPLESNASLRTVFCGEALSLSANRTFFLAPLSADSVLERIVIVSDTATSSSGGVEWQFELETWGGATTLFSATVGTDTVLGGVGGGEIIDGVAYILTPDQEQDVAANSVLEFRFVKSGAATTLARVSVFAEWSAG